MSSNFDHDIIYPTTEEILAIHRDIITEDDNAEEGIRNKGTVEYVVEVIKYGHFGNIPDTIHEKAMTLMRLLSANHPFVDGNKRTALNATWTFYAMNGYYFDYGEEIKAILKLLAVMERMVDQDEVTDYFGDITYPEDHERVPSFLVRAFHLPRWLDDLYDRLVEFSEEVEESAEFTDDNRERLLDMIGEYHDLINTLVEFRNENRENIPDEVIRVIDERETGWREVEELLNSIRHSVEDDGETSPLIEFLREEGVID